MVLDKAAGAQEKQNMPDFVLTHLLHRILNLWRGGQLLWRGETMFGEAAGSFLFQNGTERATFGRL
eukprot:9397394-Prorocentrum_lima.AAC.1